ncbi:MAG: hypothetical protein ABSC05_06205 [Candidatus Solibacter sp.]|jgi:hypothetical protein
MSPEDIRKLLGGYATGTLTAEEQQALFAAALEDQELFDQLAREQSLRDLLRDPAARAELLSALDAPAGRTAGFWQWLRRPEVAGLAMAGVVAIAVVAVWQGARIAGVKPPAQPVIVAEVRPQEAPPAVPPVQPPPPAAQPESKVRPKLAEAPAAARADKQTTGALTPPSATPPPAVPRSAAPPSASVAALATDAAHAMPPPPPPPPVAMPAVMAKKAEAAPPPRQLAENVEVQASAGVLDARALFYANLPAPGANAFVQTGGGSGGGGATLPAAAPPLPRADAAPRTAKKAISGLAASIAATAPRLGVRISILRGEREADLTTVLDPGETVRLKLVPNADGFLYVAEGARLVASGPAVRLKPFETPELRFQGSGQKQLYVMFSRRPRTVDPQSFAALARDNLVQSSAEQERATYVVNGPSDAVAQQVVVPVTLTYR